MKVLFIATFPARHFLLYGKEFLKTTSLVLKHLNKSDNHHLDMHVSIDDLSQLHPIDTKEYKYVKLIDYKSSLYGRSEFVKNVKVQDETKLDIAGDVARQIIRWSYKGMMQLYYLKEKNKSYDYIIYIDADTKFIRKFSINDLSKLLPANDELLSAVFRHDIKKYTETGWIAWNTQHSRFHDWVQLYSKGWNNHVYESLGAYHDCAIFDWTCKNLNDVKYKNLSGGGDHGFNSGILGRFIDHKKGIRKHLGFSYENIWFFNKRIGHFTYKIIFGIYIKLKKYTLRKNS